MLKRISIDRNITLFSSELSNVNAVLIDYDEHLVCVDTLHRPSDSKELASHIVTYHKPLRYLINTHGHSDHCLGNRFLKQQDTHILAHEKFYRTALAESAFLKNAVKHLSIGRILQPDICFSGDIHLMDSHITIIHSPGHSPDSCVIYLTEQKILITGDTVLNSDSEKVVIPYFYWGGLDEMLVSLQVLNRLDVDLVIPGHGSPCYMDKIQMDILYLQNFKTLLDDFIEQNELLPVEKMKEMAAIHVGIEDCLPGLSKREFWVPKMHQLNIERYIEWKIQGISVDTLDFSNHIDMNSI